MMWGLCVFPTGTQGGFGISSEQSCYVWPTSYGSPFELDRIHAWLSESRQSEARRDHVMEMAPDGTWENPSRAAYLLMCIANKIRREALASKHLDLDADARLAAEPPLILKALPTDIVLVASDSASAPIRFSFRSMLIAQLFGPENPTAMLAASRALERAAFAILEQQKK